MVDNIEEEGSSTSRARQKVVFVGDVSVGKTSIINRFIDNKFRDTYEPSIGVDFSSKTLRTKNKSFKLQIWDSAGQERYKSLIPTYIRGASIIFIVYDISKRESFESVPTWISFVKNYENSLIVLCANKLDLNRQVEYSEGEKLADKEGLLFFEISAKTNENVNMMFYFSVAELPLFDKTSNKQQIVTELQECNESVSDIVHTNPGNVSSLNMREGSSTVHKRSVKTEKPSSSCKC